MFYVLIESESAEACLIVDDDGVPQWFDTEDAAVNRAKDYNGNTLVLRAVGRVVDKTTHKYTKIK